jgi:hypothetical protein
MVELGLPLKGPVGSNLRRIHPKKQFQMHNTIVTIPHLQTPSPLKHFAQNTCNPISCCAAMIYTETRKNNTKNSTMKVMFQKQ